MPQTANLVSLPDACRRLGLSYAVVYRLICTGTLPARQVGRAYRIDVRDIERLATKLQQVGGPLSKASITT